VVEELDPVMRGSAVVVMTRTVACAMPYWVGLGIAS
jgi:hypothetical protein